MKNIDKEKLIEQLQEEIQYCATCQPYDSGDVVWILGEETELEELLDDFKVPESIRDEIAESLRCPNCGCQFERGAQYGKKSAGEILYEKLIDKKQKEWFGKYNQSLDDFMGFIEKYPYLGAKHSLGKKIIELMPKFPMKNIETGNWFRARKIIDGKKFTHDDMTAPNPDKIQVGEGRFNHFGQSHFYLSNTDIGAAREMLANTDEKLAWIQNITIHNVNTILDVRVGSQEPDPDASIIATGLIYFSDALNSAVERNKYWKPEYFVPRFVADAAKHAGFNGILYTSNHHYFDNLVIFDLSTIEYEFKGDPYIFTLNDEGNEVQNNSYIIALDDEDSM